MRQKSNREVGAENLETLRRWLERAEGIPERHGSANISAIAVAAGLDRQVLYRPAAREMIAKAVAEKGLGMPDQERADGAEGEDLARANRRIHELEQQLAAAKAELHDLRRRLRRYEHLEIHLAETGMLPR